MAAKQIDASPRNVRALIDKLAADRNISLASLSRAANRNEAYLQQFVRRGTPKELPEDVRLFLAMCFEIDERRLGARDPWQPK
jgi:hypothetical protein